MYRHWKLVDTPQHQCGQIKDAGHYILDCELYERECMELMNRIKLMMQNETPNTSTNNQSAKTSLSESKPPETNQERHPSKPQH